MNYLEPQVTVPLAYLEGLIRENTQLKTKYETKNESDHELIEIRIDGKLFMSTEDKLNIDKIVQKLKPLGLK